MFVLRTGLQGNGKTLNTIKEVDQKAFAEGRTVYYCNVTGFNPGHPAIKATWVPFDHPERWFELPANAMIVIDEAQTWFRVRSQGSKVPDYASRLEIMRKDGHELHAITQSPKLIDAHMRELCNCHIHYHRGNGGNVIKRWQFQKPELAVNSNQLNFANGESTRITVDKTYFGCYESVKEGAAHHFKFRIPQAAYGLALAALFVAGVGYYLYGRLTSFEEASEATAAPAVAQLQPAPSSAVSSDIAPVTLEQYVEARTPRIAGVASSAPIYDELTKPVSFPKPSCYATKSEEVILRKAKILKLGHRDGRVHGCSCLSQQGSRMDVPFDACMDMVENGSFDPTKPDRQPRPDGGPDSLREAGTPAGAPAVKTAVVDVPPRQPLAVGLTGTQWRYD